ncbi:neuroendocrine convertase 1-like isoform X1 [Macrosteles quadrilineatus]|uniref:neuroendocrine convertase 1-like isoform X1 n=1 Tax=Macrosteles quadrilineatus TaxID=74068 RepID=UPI0023E0F678|nr:neuroendocrine convertase 1-like isoform X1 [Macrosteles quadrilineatus]
MVKYYFVLLCTILLGNTSGTEEGVVYYTNSWIVEIPGGIKVAKCVALKTGFILTQPVWLFDDHYIFLRSGLPLRQRFSKPYLTNLLIRNKNVLLAKQQSVRHRVKKSFDDPNLNKIVHPIPKPNLHAENKTENTSNNYFDFLETIGSWLGLFEDKEKIKDNVEIKKGYVSEYFDYFDDPLWKKQWYGLRSPLDKSGIGLGMSLMEVYKMNITGEGVRIAVVDDGVDVTHPDLQQNYDAEYSYDLNHNGSDVTPGYKYGIRYYHGTRCAGILSMAANNRECGVGVAYNAKLAAIKMLEQPGVDVVEGQALRYKCEGIDVFSNSWGPGDSGTIMENMGTLSGKAIQRCLQIGRNGKGSIYLFPAGNGKVRGDNCGADAYSNSLYLMTIASATRSGGTTHYSERCSAIFATTYSSGGEDGEGVVTTDPDNTCHNRFGSTSASVPMAAGIVALALQANPNLTYRDVKHLIVMSSEVAPLANNQGSWRRNAAGFWVSMDFGFGLMNAKRMVDLAKTWTTVPENRNCSVSLYFREAITINKGQLLEAIFDTSACSGTSKEVVYLEQLQVVPFIQYGCRGAISIQLTSPTGTTSTLLETRKNDISFKGLIGWPLKSVHFWGERPSGVWMLRIKIHPLHIFQVPTGKFKGFLLIFSGTQDKPLHYNSLPREYSPFNVK